MGMVWGLQILLTTETQRTQRLVRDLSVKGYALADLTQAMERKWSVAASERQSRERSGEEIRVFPQSSETNRTFPKHKMFLATHLCLRDPEAIRTYLGLSEAIKKLKFFVTAAHIAFSAGFSLISG